MKHLAAMVGDHSGQPPRDVHPDKTPVTIFTDDGEVWHVTDLPSSLLQLVREHVVRPGESFDECLSRIVVQGLTEWIDKQERGF